jgi:hypothetical protein
LDQLQLAFGVAVCALYGTGKLAVKLETSANTRGAEERQLVDNLLLWFAREIGADYQRQAREKLDATRLQGRADLCLVVMSAAAYPKLEPWAEYRDPWLAVWDDALLVPSDWTSRQMAFGSLLHRLRGARLPSVSKSVQVGDLVHWAGERDLPWVVGSVSGHKVALIEPAGGRGTQKKVLLSSIASLDIGMLMLGAASRAA